MRAPTLGLLAALGIAAIAFGWYFGTATTPTGQIAAPGGVLMFPGLVSRLKDAAKIEITQQARQTVLRKRPDDAWGIASMHNYPVRDAKLRGLLTGLTELRLTEPRTSDSAQFSRLGVDDPKGAGSSANLLQVLDTAEKPVAAVIVGHRRVRGQANVPDEVYVRRPGDNQSWLAEGSLQADAEPASWLNRDIMNIGHERIMSVTVDEEAVVFGQSEGKFTLTQPADHPSLDGGKVSDVSRALESLTLLAVKTDADVSGQPAGRAMFTTNDGLAVGVATLHLDKDVWARFTVSATSEKAKTEADGLNSRLAGWTYQIGSWKEKSLVPTIDDLKAQDPATPPPEVNPK